MLKPVISKIIEITTSDVAENVEELPSVIPPRLGNQPINDFDTFLSGLPQFGEEAARLRKEIRKDRALRRAVEDMDC
jgi:hypothetical protein